MTEKKLGDRVTGAGFDRSELSADELAQLRHRHQILDEEFRSPDSLIQQAKPDTISGHIGLKALSNLSLALQKNKIAIAGVVSLLGYLNWEKIANFAILASEVFK